MNFESIALLTVIVILIFLLYKEVFHPAVSFLLAITSLLALGILSPDEALEGFSNEQVATIALLLVVSSVLKKLDVVDVIFRKIISYKISYRNFLLRLMVAVSFVSAFLNNTPLVATLMPYVYEWGRKKGIPPSKLMIPLSYAAIMGGTATLIGTSTNLLVNGLAVESGLKPFGVFDFSYVGVPAVIAGTLYMVFLGSKLLPERVDVITRFFEKKKEYVVETFVPDGSPIVGKTVVGAGLRNLDGLFLVEIIRKKSRIAPVSPSDVIKEGDILIFAGETEKVVELINRSSAFRLPKICSIDVDGKVEVVEALIPPNSSLVGKRVKDTDFRGNFDAAILAIHRNGEKLRGKIGEIVLKPGDLLLILAGKDFWKRVGNSNDLYVITKVKDLYPIKDWKVIFVLVGFLFAVILSALGKVSLFYSMLILISTFFITKVTSYPDVKRTLDLDLIVISSLSLALGTAMMKTNLAEYLAYLILSFAEPLGKVAVLFSVYLISNILTEFITNLAAASIVFPIALSVARSLSVTPEPFILAVAFGASASFLTPIGYQTNLMVYGLGNYRFSDFLKVGLPLSIIYSLITVTVLSLRYF